MKTDTICFVPFRELHINPYGKYRNCCIQKEVMGKIKPNLENPNEWFKKNKPMQDLRNDLIVGIKNKNCDKCWTLEDKNLSSYRLNWNQQYKNKNNIDLESRIEVLDLRLGNKCNLQCRMCNSTWSDQISKQIEELTALGVKNSYTQMPITGVIQQSSDFMNDLFYFVKNTPTLKEIKLAGGEPFVMDEVEEFLAKLVENKITNLELSLLTNVTVVKDRIVEILEKFSSTHIQCSIDGIGELLEYQRFPSKWSVIERNFIKLYNSLLTVNLTPCWSNLNILSVADFLEWTNQFPKSHVAYNEVTTPTYLDWKLVPLAARKNTINKLSLITMHSKVHKDYSKFIQQFSSEARTFTDEELIKYADAIESWDLISKIKYKDLYSWNEQILK
jgi:hypothetical protein